MSARHERGQALVEFALVAPLFLLLLFSIIEFGRAVYYIQMLDNAAREGARYAIVHGVNSSCASGPYPDSYGAVVPVGGCPDPSGAKVVAAVKDMAIAIIDSDPEDFVVSVRWCDAHLPVDTCLATEQPGNGTNARGETVDVQVAYTYRPLLMNLVPVPTFTLTGGSTLVVNN